MLGAEELELMEEILDLFGKELELILCVLVTSDPKPIPTLSEWGLIAMAGVLGLVGLYAVRRRGVAV